MFSAGEYLLGVMDSEIEKLLIKAPEKVREILEMVDRTTSIEEIVKIIKNIDTQLSTSLVETEQQYLSPQEQLNQSKKIAKCKVLNYYGLMRGITYDEKGKLTDISGFTQIMRNGYSSSEWLYSGEIAQNKIIDIPQILIDSLSLLKQAEFQGKDKEILRRIEQEILRLAVSGAKIDQADYQLEYSAHDDLKNDLTIDKAYEITDGQISYRDTNMQQIAIRSLAEMTLNKRRIIKLLKERLPDIDIEYLLLDTYCINKEMVTRQNNRGSQIGRNINFLISNYGYDFDEKTSRQIIERVEKLGDEQLKSIISQGINAQEISSLLIKTRENSKRIESTKTKKKSAKYIAEAIVEGYNWKEDGNSLTKKQKELLANALMRGEKIDNELYKLYEAINKIQIGKNKFTQNEVFAIMINLAIDGKIGKISYKDLLKKDIRKIQDILLDNKEELQTSVLPISTDLLAGRGREIDELKRELIGFGINKELLEEVGVKNIYVAKNIIEQYFIDFKLSDRYKRALYLKILDNSIIKSKSFILKSVITDFSKYKMDDKDIYGIIIKAAINGTAKDNTEYYYSYILNKSNVRESIAHEGIDSKVNVIMLEKAVAQTLSKDEKEKLYSSYKELGIMLDNDILFQNAYMIDLMLENFFGDKRIEIEDLNSIKKCFFEENVIKNILISNCLIDLSDLGMSFKEISGLLINLAVSRKGTEKEVSYSSLLNNSRNIRKNLSKIKGKMQLEVNESRILEARCRILSKEEKDNIMNRLNKMGISSDFLSSIELDNIYIAQQIVEKYFENQKIDDGIKKSIIINLLKPLNLNTSDTKGYISSLLKRIQDKGYSFIESCGLIINMSMGVNVISKEGYSYSNFLRNRTLANKLDKYKGRINTKVNQAVLEKANWQSLDEKERNILYEDLEKKYGISIETLKIKSEFNLYLAKRIVDLYDESLEDSEKGVLIQSILNNSFLNKDKGVLLFPIMNQFEDLWHNPKQMAGMIINLSVGDALEQTGLSYNEIIQNKRECRNKIKKYKDNIRTNITPITIMKAQINTMGIKQKEEILGELEQLGIDKDTIKNVKFNNLLAGYLLLKKCCEREAISKENQRIFLKRIISCSDLNINATSNLINIIKVLNDSGLNENEILHFLIIAATNGIEINNKKFSYKDIITNAKNSHYELVRNIKKIETELTAITILKAKSQMVESEEIEQIKQKIIGNGIDEKMLDNRDEQDIYVANYIIERVFQNTTISEENKSKIAYYVLKSSCLLPKNNLHLMSILQNLEKMGIGENESYFLIINCAVKGKLCKGCGYSDLLLSRRKSYKLITDEVIDDNKTIDEESLRGIGILFERKISGQDIVKATMELTVEGSEGSKICDEVRTDYMRLLDGKTNDNKEGSVQGEQN